MTKPTAEESLLAKKRDLKNGYFSLTFEQYSRVAHCRPGQFVHVQIPGSEVYFRRAMSIAGVDRELGTLEIIFKVFGRGTRLLGKLHPHDPVNLLGPLGRPFTKPKKSERVVIVAGGVGFPPLLYLAGDLIARGAVPPERIEFFFGGRTSLDILERRRIKDLGVSFHPVTEDGSYGARGMVTEPVEQLIRDHPKEKFRLYACGPDGMLKATNELGLRLGVPGELSLEAPMPCGIGVCLGCVVPLTAGGHARVCIDGPVFAIGEVAL